MSHDKPEAGEAEGRRINVHQPYELRGWSRRFGISKEELLSAVAEVGAKADDVRAYLDSLHGREGLGAMQSASGRSPHRR